MAAVLATAPAITHNSPFQVSSGGRDHWQYLLRL